MKLVFPGGEHPQVLLGPGINRVGSDPGANIVIDQPGVMPRHCELHVTGHGVMLQVPQGTTVRVNGRDVDGVIALRPGDMVGFDRIQARLASIEAAVPTPHAAHIAGDVESANDDPAATAVRPVVPRYVLRGVSGNGFGRSFPVVGITTLGRAQDCNLHIDDAGLSRQHARLTPMDKGLLIEDLGSTNGCFVNGKRVQRALAVPGDEIGFDVSRFRLVAPGQGESIHVAARMVRARRPSSPRWWLMAGVLGLATIGWVAWLF
jgi:pSer/pThr/pTyr-binding forkhead associated (FHA) protein